MHFRQNLKLFCLLIILVLLFIIYIVYNTRSNSKSANFRLLNTSDVLQLLQKSNAYSNTTNNSNEKIFDLHIKYLLNSAPCDKNISIIIIVTSYFGNVETRSAMRRAFNGDELKTMNIRRVFLLGEAATDRFTTQKSIEDESDRFNDILQGNFVEAYRNLTYKHMMGLKWAADYCDNANYVVKMDDDIVIDLRKVIHYLNVAKLPIKKLLAGYVLRNMQPKRDKANKWYVSSDEYSAEYYPTFLSGWFYVTNPQTAKSLVLASKMYKYFWIDDTLITGVFAGYLQIRHYALEKYFTLHSEFMRCCINDLLRYGYECPFFVGPNGGDNNLFFEFNRIMKKCSLDNCKVRKKDIDNTCVSERKVNLGHNESAIIEKYKLF